MLNNLMVDLPLGKALVADLSPIVCDYECTKDDNYICPQQADCCKGCFFNHGEGKEYASEVCDNLACDRATRRDNNKVIYRVIDCPS